MVVAPKKSGAVPRWCNERGQQARSWGEGDLPEATVCIQFAEQFGSSQLSQGVIHFREKVDFSQDTLV